MIIFAESSFLSYNSGIQFRLFLRRFSGFYFKIYFASNNVLHKYVNNIFYKQVFNIIFWIRSTLHNSSYLTTYIYIYVNAILLEFSYKLTKGTYTWRIILKTHFMDPLFWHSHIIVMKLRWHFILNVSLLRTVTLHATTLIELDFAWDIRISGRTIGKNIITPSERR